VPNYPLNPLIVLKSAFMEQILKLLA